MGHPGALYSYSFNQRKLARKTNELDLWEGGFKMCYQLEIRELSTENVESNTYAQ